MSLHLSELIRSAVEQTLEDRIAIPFSGGLDSTTIATVAKQHADVELFSAGTTLSEDLGYAAKVAVMLGLPLNKILLDEATSLETYGHCHALLPLDFLKLEILVPVYRVAEAVSRKGHAVALFGSGAEELFIGYARYYNYLDEGKNLDSILRDEYRTLVQRDILWVKKICRKFGIEARFPFYNKELADFVFSIPLEERIEERTLKKGLLREAAKFLGTPDLALKRRKKAMQYGSGIHKMLLRHVDEINRSYPVL